MRKFGAVWGGFNFHSIQTSQNGPQLPCAPSFPVPIIVEHFSMVGNVHIDLESEFVFEMLITSASI